MGEATRFESKAVSSLRPVAEDVCPRLAEDVKAKNVAASEFVALGWRDSAWDKGHNPKITKKIVKGKAEPGQLPQFAKDMATHIYHKHGEKLAKEPSLELIGTIWSPDKEAVRGPIKEHLPAVVEGFRKDFAAAAAKKGLCQWEELSKEQQAVYGRLMPREATETAMRLFNRETREAMVQLTGVESLNRDEIKKLGPAPMRAALYAHEKNGAECARFTDTVRHALFLSKPEAFNPFHAEVVRVLGEGNKPTHFAEPLSANFIKYVRLRNLPEAQREQKIGSMAETDPERQWLEAALGDRFDEAKERFSAWELDQLKAEIEA